MGAQVIQRDQLGELSRIGQGGQGVVYGAPKVATKFAASMVYKEYKPAVLAGIDFIALAAMPALVEDALSYQQAERLISLAAWPCALVHDGGAPRGFVMPVIPEAFFTELTTVKGVSSTPAEFQHLLNHSSVLAARGIAIDDVQRYTLLREAASALAFLHKHGVCVGDISPKNLLYTLSPQQAIYFIDCDAMRINDVSALTQVETPGWGVPSGEELATIYSDTYKLGLLALRLLAGDHDTTNPAHLPATTPALLRQLITDTVTNEAERRPLPQAWTYVLGHAIEEAQHRTLTTPTAVAPATIAIAAPEVPTLRSRPPAATTSTPPKPPPRSARPTPASRPPTPPPPSRSTSPATAILAAVGIAIVIAVVVLTIVLTNQNNDANTNASPATTDAPTYSSVYSTAPSASVSAAAAFVAPADLLQTADLTGDTSCIGGKPIPNHPGGRAGPGSNKTSCTFAWNVGQAYWASNPSPNAVQRVIARGAVACPDVQASAPSVQCSGNAFVMTCAMYGSDRWITCTGGNEAKVYIF
jgi:eukaryotic-like serine/threonine-protein kinase